MWQAYDAIERLAGAAKTLLAARVEQSGVAQRAGDRGTAEYLARKSGSSLGAARASLEAPKKMAELPHTPAALCRGELSRPQAEEIANAAAANPGAEQSLLHATGSSSLSELRDACARTRAQADTDPEATHRRIQRDRRLRRWTDGEGAWNLAARGTGDAGSRLNAALDPIIDELFHTARRQGRRRRRQRHPPRPRAHHGAACRPPLELTGVHRPRLPTTPPPGHPARPPDTLDRGPPDHPRQHRPPLRPPPRPEDPARLGAGARHRSTTDGPTRRPPPPRQPSQGLPARRRSTNVGTAVRRTMPVRRRRLTQPACTAPPPTLRAAPLSRPRTRPPARSGGYEERWPGYGRSTGAHRRPPRGRPRDP